MPITPISVTELSNYIKLLLDKDDLLSHICVKGELSNYKIHSSGHHYFTLKDDGAVISAVMFRGEAGKLRFTPESGMKVILSGRVSSFPKSGQYQIYASDIQPDGIGALFIAFEQLKERLQSEGLFDRAHKQPLPKYPKKVAVVTSPTGAAVRDIIRVLGSRFPLSHVLVCPVKVQGDGSALEIADVINYINEHSLADVIIAGRGGGSIEDLWAFNEEVVARAIYNSKIPTISAVGHEPDVTIADFVADVRAATPSNAAELAVCDGADLKNRLQNVLTRITGWQMQYITRLRDRLNAISSKQLMQSPFEYLNERTMSLNMLEQKLGACMGSIVADKRREYVKTAATLDAISPLKVLSRGYAMIDSQKGVVKTVAELVIGDNISINFADGQAGCTVREIKKQ